MRTAFLGKETVKQQRLRTAFLSKERSDAIHLRTAFLDKERSDAIHLRTAFLDKERLLSYLKADERTRTVNLLITNQLLCQLSHIGI